VDEMTSLPIDRMSAIGDTVQPKTTMASTKRESPKQKQRQSELESSDDPEQSGRLLDIEA